MPSVFAEPTWPKRVASAEFVKVDTATLPKGLRSALLGTDEFTQGTDQIPVTLNVSRIDLNGDGVAEFIVQSPEHFSGGPAMWIFQRQKGEYVEIAYTGGRIYFASRVNGYFQIVYLGRAGGGVFTRVLQRYDHGRYHTVRIADYRYGEKGKEEFIEERDPKN